MEAPPPPLRVGCRVYRPSPGTTARPCLMDVTGRVLNFIVCIFGVQRTLFAVYSAPPPLCQGFMSLAQVVHGSHTGTVRECTRAWAVLGR